MNYTIYIHIFPNNKKYIGITEQNIFYRWNNGRGYKYNQHLYNAILKYGWNNIEHCILEDYLSKEMACNREKHYINLFKSNDRKYGYNKSIGGELTGLGVHNKHSREHIEKIRKAHIGRKATAETKEKLKISHIGQKAWNKGLKMSEEQKQKLRKPKNINKNNLKKILCIEKNVIYYGLKSVAKNTGISMTNISKCCKGKQHTAGGYHWQYL